MKISRDLFLERKAVDASVLFGRRRGLATWEDVVGTMGAMGPVGDLGVAVPLRAS